MVPTIGSSGVQLIHDAQAKLDRGAQTIARAAAGDPTADVGQGALDVIDGSTMHHAGVTLVGIAAAIQRRLLDIFA